MCHKTDSPHNSHGVCKNCIGRYHYKTNPERRRKHGILVARWRKEHPERSKEIVLKAVRKYYKKNKNNPAYLVRTKQSALKKKCLIKLKKAMV